MTFTPYLGFQGQCAEAFAAYAAIFGGTPTLMRFTDLPEADRPPLDEAQRDWIMHGELVTPTGARLMGADMPVQFGGQVQAGVCVAVSRPTAADARAVFDRLAEGGSMQMAFGPTFFSTGFGMCRDRFGTAWMVDTGDPATRR